MDKVEITLISKRRLLISLMGCILFVVLGVFISMSRDKVAGIAAILLFGTAGLFYFKKLFDKNIGVTIDDMGITDNSSAMSIGLIKWSDIIDIKAKHVLSSKFLLVYVKDPDSILEQVTGLKRKAMVNNQKAYGTPLVIATTINNYNFDNLEKLVMDRFKAQQG